MPQQQNNDDIEFSDRDEGADAVIKDANGYTKEDL